MSNKEINSTNIENILLLNRILFCYDPGKTNCYELGKTNEYLWCATEIINSLDEYENDYTFCIESVLNFYYGINASDYNIQSIIRYYL